MKMTVKELEEKERATWAALEAFETSEEYRAVDAKHQVLLKEWCAANDLLRAGKLMGQLEGKPESNQERDPVGLGGWRPD